MGRKNRRGCDSEGYGREALELVRQGEWTFMSLKSRKKGRKTAGWRGQQLKLEGKR